MIGKLKKGIPNKRAMVNAALTLADAKGLRRLSIRTLAHEVGVAPMTLHGRFKSKELLFDAMFERALEKAFVVRRNPTWQEGLRASCAHARSMLLEHPHWIPLLARPAVPTSSLAFFDTGIREMLKRGCARDQAILALSSALSLTVGFVLVERMMLNAHGHPILKQRFAELRKMLPALPPTFASLSSVEGAFEDWSFDQVFELSLSSLLTGIEAHWAPPQANAS